MVRWVIRSILHGGPISHSSQCSTIGVTRYVLSCLWGGAYKRPPCCYSERVAHVVAVAGFLSRYMNGPLPYVQYHITIKMY